MMFRMSQDVEVPFDRQKQRRQRSLRLERSRISGTVTEAGLV
jgi:hypothetical protein